MSLEARSVTPVAYYYYVAICRIYSEVVWRYELEPEVVLRYPSFIVSRCDRLLFVFRALPGGAGRVSSPAKISGEGFFNEFRTEGFRLTKGWQYLLQTLPLNWPCKESGKNFNQYQLYNCRRKPLSHAIKDDKLFERFKMINDEDTF